MVTVEPTTDISYIKSVLTNPEIYNDMRDDSCPEDSSFMQDIDLMSKPGIFLKAVVDGVASGVFWMIWKGKALEIHTALSKACHGRQAILAAKQLINWVFKNTDAEKIVSFAWSDQPQVRWFCRVVGMKEDGTESWPATRNGLPVTITHYSLQRGLI